MDDYRKASREYLISLLTTIKKIRRAIEERNTECEKWSRRVVLAEENGRPQLVHEAKQRLSEAMEAKNRLLDEEQEILREFRKAQTTYDIESSIPDQSVNTDQLLQSLLMLTGEPDTYGEELKSSSAETELEKLKREINGE